MRNVRPASAPRAIGASVRKSQEAPIVDTDQDALLSADDLLEEQLAAAAHGELDRKQMFTDTMAYYESIIAQLQSQLNNNEIADDELATEWQTTIDNLQKEIDAAEGGRPTSKIAEQRQWQRQLDLKRKNLRRPVEAKLARYQRFLKQTQKGYDRYYDEHGMRRDPDLGKSFLRGLTNPRALADSFAQGLMDTMIGLPILAASAPKLLQELNEYQAFILDDSRKRTERAEVEAVIAAYGEGSPQYVQIQQNQLNTRMAWMRENAPNLVPVFEYYHESLVSAFTDPETFAQTLEERPFDVYIHALDAIPVVGGVIGSAMKRGKMARTGRIVKGVSRVADAINPENMPFIVGGRAYNSFQQWRDRNRVRIQTSPEDFRYVDERGQSTELPDPDVPEWERRTPQTRDPSDIPAYTDAQRPDNPFARFIRDEQSTINPKGDSDARFDDAETDTVGSETSDGRRTQAQTRAWENDPELQNLGDYEFEWQAWEKMTDDILAEKEQTGEWPAFIEEGRTERWDEDPTDLRNRIRASIKSLGTGTPLLKEMEGILQRRRDRASTETFQPQITRRQLDDWGADPDVYFRIDVRGRRETSGWMGEESYIHDTVIPEVAEEMADSILKDPEDYDFDWLEDEIKAKFGVDIRVQQKLENYDEIRDYIINDILSDDVSWLDPEIEIKLEYMGITYEGVDKGGYRSDGIYVVNTPQQLARYTSGGFFGDKYTDLIQASEDGNMVVQVVRGDNPRTPPQFGTDELSWGEQLISDPEVIAEFPADTLLNLEHETAGNWAKQLGLQDKKWTQFSSDKKKPKKSKRPKERLRFPVGDEQGVPLTDQRQSPLSDLSPNNPFARHRTSGKSTRQSRTVWTRHYDGVSNAEIAEELGIPETEVADMIARSKQKINNHFLRKLGWLPETQPERLPFPIGDEAGETLTGSAFSPDNPFVRSPLERTPMEPSIFREEIGAIGDIDKIKIDKLEERYRERNEESNQLAERMLKGDETALTEFMEKYEGYVWKEMRNYDNPIEDKEEAFSDVMHLVWNNMIHIWDEVGREKEVPFNAIFHSYMKTAVLNELRKKQQGSKYRPTDAFFSPNPEREEHYRMMEEDRLSSGELMRPERAVIKGEYLDIVEEAIGHLNETDRQIVKLRLDDGLTFEEIAREVNLSESHAHKRFTEAEKMIIEYARAIYEDRQSDVDFYTQRNINRPAKPTREPTPKPTPEPTPAEDAFDQFAGNPEQYEVDNPEIAEAIRDAMNNLSESEHLALTLRFMMDHNSPDTSRIISEEYGIKESSARIYPTRAKRKIVRAIEKALKGEKAPLTASDEYKEEYQAFMNNPERYTQNNPETARVITDAIDNLSEREYQFFTLRLEGVQPTQISKMLDGVSTATVKSYLKNATRKIVDAIEESRSDPKVSRQVAETEYKAFTEDPKRYTANNPEIAETIETAVQNLNEDLRTVFQLRYLENFSIAETAKRIGIPTTSVPSRMTRAKRKIVDAIKRALKEKSESDNDQSMRHSDGNPFLSGRPQLQYSPSNPFV